MKQSTLDSYLLDNVLLYLSSAMAQVWAALLVYEAIKAREDERDEKVKLQNILSEIREKFEPMLRFFKEYDVFFKKYSHIDLPISDLQDLKSFKNQIFYNDEALIRLLKLNIKQPDLLKKAYGHDVACELLKSNDGAEVFDAVETYFKAIEETNNRIGKTKATHSTAVVSGGLIANIFLLSLLPLIDFLNFENTKCMTKYGFLLVLAAGNTALLYHQLIKKSQPKPKASF